MIVTYLESGLGVNLLTHRDSVCPRTIHSRVIPVRPLKARFDKRLQTALLAELLPLCHKQFKRRDSTC